MFRIRLDSSPHVPLRDGLAASLVMLRKTLWQLPLWQDRMVENPDPGVNQLPQSSNI